MYNTIKSDRQYRKTDDNSRLRKLYGDLDLINIREGIKQTIKWFRDNYEVCRK